MNDEQLNEWMVTVRIKEDCDSDIVCMWLRQISLDLVSANDKFVGMLKTSLFALSQLLEVASVSEVGKYAEELLSFMCSTIGPDPVHTVLCVQQVSRPCRPDLSVF